MNNVVLIGNLCRDGEVRYSIGENATAIYRNSIAVQRKFKDKSTGNYESDFIGIEAFGKTAEFLDKYFPKGSKVAVTGEIRTGSYVNKDGQKVYTTDVLVNNAEFCTKRDENSVPQVQAQPQTPEFMAISSDIEEDLPFK
ncbi:single-strand DNA-binding protein [Eubacterium ruminantium]|uniref:Single-stranded DNA-binding protein n=1 Tax=Eubacterium ruminantium TaxID=42322 RepID=A0A1T4P1L0_9FIRM|nr:single-stranded DNA-binding protein [Eubacterium ruminantium]SCW57061.1 single-strand DNA-binding protein [Eubacterium ruminantium]SDN07826.1 single-strand DNA-binding protein [Eubacterium ruminantium]SJZ85383.1 single-strand binding protein [Eubacterium ruminantium]